MQSIALISLKICNQSFAINHIRKIEENAIAVFDDTLKLSKRGKALQLTVLSNFLFFGLISVIESS